MRSPTRQRVVALLKLALAAGLVYWLLSTGRLDFSQLAELGGRWRWLIAAQVAFAGAQVVAAMRWRLLLRAQGISYTLRGTSALILIGWFFNQLVIGTTGGDIYRAYTVAREQPERRSGAVVSVFVDRALGLGMLLVVVAVALLLNPELLRAHVEIASFAGVLAVGLGCALVAVVVLYSPRLRGLPPVRWTAERMPFQNALRSVDAALNAYRERKRETSLAALLSVAVHGFTITMNIFLARAVIGPSFDPLLFFVLIPMAHAAMAIPINPPGALGTAEALYSHLLGLIGVSQGGLICILQRISFYLWALPGAVLYVGRRSRFSCEARADDDIRPEAPGLRARQP